MLKLKNILRFNILYIGLFIFLIGYVFIFTKFMKYESKYQLADTVITGIITNYSFNGNKLALDIKAQEKIKATYYLKTETELTELQAKICLGCSIKFQGQGSNPLNNTIPNTFNYRKYLYAKRIYRTYQIAKLTIYSDNNWIYKIKDYFYKRIDTLEHSDYLKIFIFGDKSLISSEEYTNFQENGVAHLLAISGMHIGVFLKILDLFLKNLKLSKKTFIVTGILFFYAFLTNFSASILRAVLFYFLLNIKKLKNFKMSNFQVLLITAFSLIIIDPFIVYDVGFIYSFVITGGIILSHKLIKGNYFTQLLIISLISFVFSLPITVNLNYEINFASIIANLFFVPYVSIIVYPLALLTFIMPVVNPLFSFTIMLLTKINTITNLFKIMLIMPKLNWVVIGLYYFLLLVCLNNFKYFVGLGILLLVVKFLPKLDNNYYIYYLDVGQGDSFVLISPHQQEIIMLDTGGKIEYEQDAWQKQTKSYQLSDNTLKFLKSLGITQINYLLLSHGDIDHAGEALNILNNFKVKNVVLNKGPLNDLEKKISEVGPITTQIKSKYFPLINLNNTVNTDENISSAVYYLKIYQYGFLFMGDAPKMIEEEIIKNYHLKVDFLKLGHHGSNTSSSEMFIKNLNFQYGIISSGRNNIYGHPAKETLATLEKYARKYLNTQTSGTIELTIRPKAYTIKEYQP